ncbi:hypothetical protein [Phascolarctobacterium succinatutens]|uniref:hypothetical protein n=1 Tax=Phascolarctobacterium succinatutens TaxID=626940 RepID=UPI0026EA1C1C|nr:hypothetical protein [Phascolarctobacterium succinatutens]
MTIKTNGLLVWLFFWCCFSVPCYGYAEAAHQKMYQISETELTRLELNLATLKNHNKTYKEELKKQQTKLNLLHKELETWQAKSKTTELLLKNANASFELYAKEEKSKIEKAKRQRNLYILLSTCLAYSLVKQLN